MKPSEVDNVVKQEFDNIRIVLVQTSHPGNIGAAARAMKTMQRRQLALVKPKVFPSAEVTARAAGADDILHQAQVFESLPEALKDCGLVIATTARDRSIPWPVLSPREAAREITSAAKKCPVALVFGRERSGLTNEEIDLCNKMIQIPANPEFSSLNLAAAIQIVCYEILQVELESKGLQTKSNTKTPLATHEEMEMLYEHLRECMTDVGFFDPDKPRRLMRRLKRLFNRAELDQNELNILRGFLAAVQDKIKK